MKLYALRFSDFAAGRLATKEADLVPAGADEETVGFVGFMDAIV